MSTNTTTADGDALDQGGISAEQPRDVTGDNLRRWLALTPETAEEPDRPIIDPHHHLWDRRPRPDAEADARTHHRYLADDLIQDIRGGGHNVIDTVFVECRSMYRQDRDDPLRSVGETEFVQGVAAVAASGLYGENVRCCGGIVGFANLTLAADVEPVLRAHMAAGANFRGIRHAHGWHPSPDIANSHHPTRDIEGLLGKADYRAGFAVLDELGLTFDSWGFHTQLTELADLARVFPRTTIILNHIGGPMAYGPYTGQRETTVFDDWKAAMRVVAPCDNVVVKVGGCGMPTYGFGHEKLPDGPPDSTTLARDWKPYFEFVIGEFGAERCMFESNYPVDKVSCSYVSMWNAFKRIADELSLTSIEKNDLFYGTAARSYSIALNDNLNGGLSAPAPSAIA